MKRFSNKWIMLSILALTWGSSFILIRKSLLVFTPFQIGSIRVIISGLAFVAIGLPALLKMDKRTFLWMTLAGAMGNFVPMYLFPIAQTKVSSSMAGILDSLVPVFVLLIGFLIFRIRSKAVQWWGTVLGFAGAGTLMYFSSSAKGGSDAGYGMLIVLATALYAGSALIVNQKLQHVPSLQLSASVFTFWMIPSAIILLCTNISGVLHNSHEVRTAAAFLGILSIVGTAIAILLYFSLIQATSAVFASMVTYLIPVVAVFWGLLAGEKFSIWYGLGGILILSGIYLVQDKNELEEEIDEIDIK